MQVPDITESTLDFDIIPKDWSASPADRLFSSNEMIAAYTLGKEKARNEAFEDAKQELTLNIRTATAIAEELMKIIQENKIELRGIHLKPLRINYFEFLFLVEEESYHSENFINAYSLSRSIKEKYKSSKLDLEFSFTEDIKDLSIECLVSDGFFMRYDQRAKA